MRYLDVFPLASKLANTTVQNTINCTPLLVCQLLAEFCKGLPRGYNFDLWRQLLQD